MSGAFPGIIFFFCDGDRLICAAVVDSMVSAYTARGFPPGVRFSSVHRRCFWDSMWDGGLSWRFCHCCEYSRRVLV